jgi:hypothetical protein
VDPSQGRAPEPPHGGASDLAARQARLSAAERVAAFVLERTAAKAGPRAIQSKRCVRPLEGELPPSLETFASRLVLKVPLDAERGLFGLAAGTHRAVVMDYAPSPEALLCAQARGERVVSLLAPGSDTGHHEDPLAFAVHDLCHLEKFQVDHAGQVGFFETMRRARILSFGGEHGLDDAFQADAVAVTCDMNGSPIFLLAALKMRMKMAVRRTRAVAAGRSPKIAGPLDADEEAAYAPILEDLLDRAELEGEMREAAREITARRQGMDRAHLFLEEMERRGRES